MVLTSGIIWGFSKTFLKARLLSRLVSFSVCGLFKSRLDFVSFLKNSLVAPLNEFHYFIFLLTFLDWIE